MERKGGEEGDHTPVHNFKRNFQRRDGAHGRPKKKKKKTLPGKPNTEQDI